MQIKNLPKNLYRFYAWARSQECLDAYREKIEGPVKTWESLRAEGVSEDKCARFTGISRATFYRYRACLQALLRGEVPPSKAPKKRNKPRWGEREKQLVLELRRANPTWGKAKIAQVLRAIVKSGVQRILHAWAVFGWGCLMPSLKSMPSMTSARWAKPVRRRQFCSAHWPSLKVM